MRLSSKQPSPETGGFTIFELMECSFGASIALLLALFLNAHFVWATGRFTFLGLWLGSTVIFGLASVILFSYLFRNLNNRWAGRCLLVLLLATVALSVVAGRIIRKGHANPRSGVDAGTALCLHLLRCWPGATHRDCEAS